MFGEFLTQIAGDTLGDSGNQRSTVGLIFFLVSQSITVDGASCSRMFAEFITYLNKLINNEESEVTSMPNLPPVDLYMDGVIQPKWYNHVMQLVLEILCIIPLFPEFMTTRMLIGKGNVFMIIKKHGWKSNEILSFNQGRRLFPWSLQKVETSSFLKKCKEPQTTVQGAAQIAAGIAMVTMLEEQQCEVDSYVTVNVRPFLKSKVPDNHAGAYCQGLQCKNLIVLSADAVQFWSMARQTSGDIHIRFEQQ
ncbi:hypothetical protein OS493_020923 [Desmophyllum pertusum]|uniref:Uncharacterized protein n=1 Tax=Desmophyllum pertusum TaxID=174260 RepID=A0A9W9ZZW0_9CNID|nr:hypothetical protein OS493_020923 [Desmophyllum pertusum]